MEVLQIVPCPHYVTGRHHQLRHHCAEVLGTPIVNEERPLPLPGNSELGRRYPHTSLGVVATCFCRPLRPPSQIRARTIRTTRTSIAMLRCRCRSRSASNVCFEHRNGLITRAGAPQAMERPTGQIHGRPNSPCSRKSLAASYC